MKNIKKSAGGRALLFLLALNAVLLTGGCGKTNVTDNVTNGKPLPPYHHSPGALTGKAARDYWMSQRKPGP